jgi:hypothetical protein
MCTKTAIPDTSLNTQGPPSVRLPTQYVKYIQRCFRQSIPHRLFGISTWFSLSSKWNLHFCIYYCRYSHFRINITVQRILYGNLCTETFSHDCCYSLKNSFPPNHNSFHRTLWEDPFIFVSLFSYLRNWFTQELLPVQCVSDTGYLNWVLVSPCESAHLPFITGAVHDCVDTPVKESILFLESWDVNWTGGVMNSATLVSHPETAKMRILEGSLPLPTPFCARYSEQIHQLSFSPVRLWTYVSYLVCLW